MRLRQLLAAIGLAAALGTADLPAQERDAFDHGEHKKVFPSCIACHQGAQDGVSALLPSGEGCATCHDGTIEGRVSWTPPDAAHSNLRFTHGGHIRALATRDSTAACGACHTPADSGWMTVNRAVTVQCLDCHGVKTAHTAAPDTACATCHLSLPEARLLTAADVGAFPEPESHQAAGFLERGGHGAQAKAPPGAASSVAPSCATCHARDFCITCHVDAPETALIQALAPDARSLGISSDLKAPAGHAASDFLTRHGSQSRKAPADCRTCHTQESCAACHNGQREVATALYAAGPGRGAGAVIVRRRPESHASDFSDVHASPAASRPATCEGCHVRTQCLDCHRPTASRTPEYHPETFLARHPTAAYARETDCSDCHNPAAFCQSCHEQSGLVSPRGQLTHGFHDAKNAFSLGHGQAARQSLETCTSCHVERDCLTCHSALFGRGFSPHGPGFDAERLRKKNPQMCTVCHGTAIPGG